MIIIEFTQDSGWINWRKWHSA